MAKIKITDKQLSELITKGRFSVEKKYLGGKVIGVFEILSKLDTAALAIKIRNENPRTKDESEEEYRDKMEILLNTEINKMSYSAKTESGEDIKMESWMLTMMDADYMEMKDVFMKLFKDGEYDDEAKDIVEGAAKNS